MHKFFIVIFILISMQFTTRAFAQVAANAIMPAEVNLRSGGWRTTLQNGNLTFGLPIATVPGDVPIPVSFGFSATFLSQVWDHPGLDANPAAARVLNHRMDWPIAAGIHFGYMTDDLYGEAPISSMPVVPPGRGMVVLEDGRQIAESRWTDVGMGMAPGMEATMGLPKVFGFPSVAPATAKVDPTATCLYYTTTEAGLGAQCRSLLLPSTLS